MINKNLLITLILIILLFAISPVIDHAFPPLDEDKTVLEILLECIIHIISIVVVLYIINKYIIYSINKHLNIDKELFNHTKPVISAVIMVGLQSHLINKLKFLTHKHPFRILNIYKD
jgi:hypothetical protein